MVTDRPAARREDSSRAEVSARCRGLGIGVLEATAREQAVCPAGSSSATSARTSSKLSAGRQQKAAGKETEFSSRRGLVCFEAGGCSYFRGGWSPHRSCALFCV